MNEEKDIFRDTPLRIVAMEVNHVDGNSRDKKNIHSIFTLFGNITGEENQNPKYFVELFKDLQVNRFSLGSTDNFDYSIKRLIKTLGSTRLHSQCGCFSCLTCLLNRKVISVGDVLNVLQKEEQNVYGATKSEVKALNTEVILACGAIVHSGLFAEQLKSTQKHILEKLVAGGKKKKYLLEIVYRFFVEIIQSSKEENFKKLIWPLCAAEVLKDFPMCSADCFHVLTTAIVKSPNTISKYLNRSLHHHFDSFLEKLLNAVFSTHVKSSHPLYGSLAEVLCLKNVPLSKLWSECVSEYGKKNSVRDHMLITLFFHVLKHIKDAGAIPLLLVPKFVEVIIRVLTFKKTKTPEDNSCRSLAVAALSRVEAVLSNFETSTQKTRLDTIKKLLLYPSNLKFEMKTGSKIVQHLILQLDSGSVKEVLKIYVLIITNKLKKVSSEGNIEENWNSKEKQIALLNLIKTLNHPSIRNDVDTKLKQLKFIFKTGFLGVGRLPPDLQKYAQECFFKAIILKLPTLRDTVFLLNELASYVNEKMSGGDFEISREVKESWKKQFSIVSELRNDLNNKFFITVHVLLLYMGFHLFVDVHMAKNCIEELLLSYSRYKSSDSRNERGGDSFGEPHWTEVTVDLILSLLSRENKLWRRVISSVFSQVSAHVTPKALHQIIDALDPKSENVILEEANLDGVDDSERSEEETESSLSEAEKGESEEISEGEEKANDQLRMAVREALGCSAALTDDDSIDMDEMDSEEEKKLNENLSNAFKLLKRASNGRKKGQTKEEEALMHFRLRILDLIEIYLTNDPPLEGCLDLILPLFNLLEFSIKNPHQTPLRNRVESILKSVSSVKKFSNADNVNESRIQCLFRTMVDKKDVSALVFVEMSPKISECAAFLVRCSQFAASDSDGAHTCLIDDYIALLKAFCLSRDFKLSICVFQNVLKMAWKGNFKLAVAIYEYLLDFRVRIFKKMKLLSLLQIFYKNKKLHDSCEENVKFELTETETNFLKTLTSHLVKCENGEPKIIDKISAAYFSQMVMLMNVVLANAKRHRSTVEQNLEVWNAFIAALAETEVISQNKKARSKIANLANSLGLVRPSYPEAGRKRKAAKENEEKVEGESEGGKLEDRSHEPCDDEPSRKKKKKKNFLKNESRKLREKLSSDMKVLRFSSVNVAPPFVCD